MARRDGRIRDKDLDFRPVASLALVLAAAANSIGISLLEFPFFSGLAKLHLGASISAAHEL